MKRTVNWNTRSEGKDGRDETDGIQDNKTEKGSRKGGNPPKIAAVGDRTISLPKSQFPQSKTLHGN